MMTVVATGASQSLLPYNRKRRALLLISPPTNRHTFAFAVPPVIDQGITLYPAGTPILITRRKIGDSICDALNVISSAAGGPITIIEWFDLFDERV